MKRIVIALAAAAFAAAATAQLPQYRVEVIADRVLALTGRTQLAEDGSSVYYADIEDEGYYYHSSRTGLIHYSAGGYAVGIQSYKNGQFVGKRTNDPNLLTSNPIRCVTGGEIELLNQDHWPAGGAHDFSESGYIVGQLSGFANGIGVIWRPDGSRIELGTWIPTNINNNGKFSGGREVGHISNPTQLRHLTVPGIPTNAYGIHDVNENDMVLGSYARNDIRSLAIWDANDVLVHQLTESFWASSMNDSMTVVGRNTLFTGTYGMIWSPASGLVDINTLLLPSSQEFHIDVGSSINNSGQFLAYATRSGVTYTVLLHPVPEPATLLALGTGSAVLLRKRRKRRTEAGTEFITLIDLINR